MRILFLTENFLPETSGAVDRIHERARFWADWGHAVTVVTTAPNSPRTERVDGIGVVRVKTLIAPHAGRLRRTLNKFGLFFTVFAASLAQRRPDIMVVASPQFFTAAAGLLVGKIRKTPVVFELGDSGPTSTAAVNRELGWGEIFLYKKAASVVAPTPGFKKSLKNRGIDGDKVAVVMDGADLSGTAVDSPRCQAEAMLQVLEIASFGWGDRAGIGSGEKR